tara:strand:+ start:1333 stop:1686 length:354 start_codon:yes stop_codon:yes gene_type:complete
MSQNLCTPLCDENGDYNYGSITTPINKYDENYKPLSGRNVYNKLMTTYRKQSSSNISDKVGMLMYVDQSSKIINTSGTGCVTNHKKSEGGSSKKHDSYHRYLAKKRGEVLYKEACKQ